MSAIAELSDTCSAEKTATAAFAAIKDLYRNGKTEEALALAAGLGQELQVIEAWCLYRLKRFGECHAAISQLPESTQTLEVMAYLYAYGASGFRDEKKLLETATKLPSDNFNRMNALVIAAREKGSTLEADTILSQLDRWIASFDRSSATVEQANLLHNAARLALEKESFPKALEIINYAIEAYGTKTNFHHLGAANYWRSVILEKMEESLEAWQAGIVSLYWWQAQFNQEPTNEEWAKRLEGAKKRESELFQKQTMNLSGVQQAPEKPD